MHIADCGCTFRTMRSIPPEHPCPEGQRLLHELPQGGFEAAAAYMAHVKTAWNNPIIETEVANGPSNRKDLD